MLYQKVGSRCAFTLTVTGLEASEDAILQLLVKRGFEVVSEDVDILANARKLVGVSRYRKGVLVSKAPDVVDCSSMIKWLYGLRGIWLPRNLFLWQDLGQWVNCDFLSTITPPINLDNVVAGDIVFTTDAQVGWGGVGHVGLATGHNTIIHATNRIGVEEISFDELIKRRLICKINRLIPIGPRTVTLSLPGKEEVESSDDIEYLVRSALRLRYR